LPPAPERKGETDARGIHQEGRAPVRAIKDSYRDKGVSADEAKEWAARTVNKLKGKKK